LPRSPLNPHGNAWFPGGCAPQRSLRTDYASYNNTGLALIEGILREPSPDENRLIVWIPEAIGAKPQVWERVSNVAGAEIFEYQGIYSTAAVSMRACAKKAGFIGGLIRHFRQQSESRTWILPNGQEAEQTGTRRTDLLLVWSDEHASLSDDSQIRSRWPQCQEIQKIADNLFLVKGVGIEAKSSTDQAEPPTITQEIAIQLADEMLASARRAHDRHREITALTDLGIVFTRIGDTVLVQRVFSDEFAELTYRF
jgi:hypothetical protein